MILLLFHFASAAIPKNLLPLANKAIKSAKYRKLMKENRTNLIEPGLYEKSGIKFRISKSLFGPPAKEIKGHAYENNYLALVPNKKYNLSQNFTNSAFALDQKMYILQNIAGSDESVMIYQVKEINPHHVITEVMMYTTNDKTGDDDSGSTIKKTLNFNWDDDANLPVFRPLISSFPNLKFGMGTKFTASASARLHSRGTNYLQLDMTFKVEGSFAAGVQTISGKQILEDHALYSNEFPIWGTSLKLFGFEFKSGLFAYIDASIINIALETAIDFIFLHGYKFEAYNRIIVCTGFPSPGYITTGWRSTVEKIDTANDARQNGPQDSYSTQITFTPRVDIGVRLGLELPGSTSSWLRAGIRGGINFLFGADAVMCDFPYLYGKIEPVISLFVGYDGLKILGFEVAPSFEVTWELYKKTIFNKECAFLDVKVSPDYVTSADCYALERYAVQFEKFKAINRTLVMPYYLQHYPVAPWKSHQTSNFKPFVVQYKNFRFNAITKADYGSIYIDCEEDYVSSFPNDSGKVHFENKCFEADYSYRKVSRFMTSCMAFCDKDEFVFSYNPVIINRFYSVYTKYAVIQADMTGGFSILQEDDVEYFDEGTPNDGWKLTGIPHRHLFIGSTTAYCKIESSNDFDDVSVVVYIRHNSSSTKQYLTTLYNDKREHESLTYLPAKVLGIDSEYCFDVYVNDTLKGNISYDSKWIEVDYINNPKEFVLDGLKIILKVCDQDEVYTRIKRKELVGPKRYVIIPVFEVEISDPYATYYKPFEVGSSQKYFLLNLKIKSHESQEPCFDYINDSTHFAILLKCPGCFPLCKHCETIDDGYYIIKLTINDTINFNNNYDIISIPMCSVKGAFNAEFTITHFIILNNEGSTYCTNNTYLAPVGLNTASYFMHSCLTPSSEALTWNASYKSTSLGREFKYELKVIAELQNRNMSLISFVKLEDEEDNNNSTMKALNLNDVYPDSSVVIYKEYLNFPDNTSNYKHPDIITVFRSERCYSLYAVKNGEEIPLKMQEDSKFLYDPKEDSTQEEIEITCRCKYEEYAFCEILFSDTFSGYYLLESKESDGITITKVRKDPCPRGQIKREVTFMQFPYFYYTKTWEGNLKVYKLIDLPDTYKITVQITVPDGKPDYRRIQLLMNGDEFNNYPIGFDVFKYMDDPLNFLSKIDLDKEADPGWIYFGDDNELYVSIDIEPKFTENWCGAAATLSPLPNDTLKSSYLIDCGKGMKMKKNVCVVNHKLSWKFWVIIASICVAVILIIVVVVVVVKKVCC